MAPSPSLTHFLQWNSRSIIPKKPDLINLINNHSVSVAAISETWLRTGSRFRVPGFSCLREDRADGRAGCALLIKRSFPFSQIPLPPHTQEINAVAATIMGINFISIYIPHPNVSLIPDLSTILFSVPSPLIILGDFNCHNTSWGSHHSDMFSSFLIDLFDDINVCVINDGSPTHRVYPGQNPQSVVDLSACSPNLSSLLSWRVLNQSFGSDHFPIIISKPLSVRPISIPEPLLKYKIQKADWPKFSSYVDSKLKNLDPDTLDNPLVNYSIFIKFLIEAADIAIPRKKTPNPNISSPPWWDSECSAAVKSRNDAELIFNDTMNTDDFIAFQRVSARTKRFLSKRKKRGWTGFCESLSPKTPPSLVWRNIKRFRGSFKPDSLSSYDSSLWLEDFADGLAPQFVPEKSCLSLSPPSNASDPFDEPFSIAELKIVLDGLRNSSPGEDGIPYIFLSKLFSFSRVFLLNLLNSFYISGEIPESWNNQIIIPILKPNKNPNVAGSYRPIALSATIGKILEHLVKNRLEWLMENKKNLADSQFGFRKGRSTMDSLSILTSDIRLALSKNDNLIGCFLDISSAYDSVLLPVLRAKMLQLSIPARIVHFVSRLFTGRTIKIRSGGSFLSPRTLWRGIPQGSVLSPLLYSIYTYDLEQSVSPFCNILQYADDLVLYSSDQSLDLASSRLNEALSYLNVWLDDHGLSLSPSKSKSVVFTRRRFIPDVDIYYEGQAIPNNDSVKFLGVILDSKMSGAQHLNYVVDKCEKGINVLRALSGVWWGSHSYCQKLMYNALIRSQIDYGSFILEPCSKIALKKLDQIQAKCLRIILGAMKSSPKNAMQVECVDPPLFLRRQYLADRFVFKAASLSSHPLLSRLEELSQIIPTNRYWSHKETPRIVKSYMKIKDLSSPIFQSSVNPLFDTNYKALVYTPRIILDFGVSKDDPCANQNFVRLLDDWQDWLPVFTDASKLSSGSDVGAAVWIPKFSIVLSFKCPPQSSVFTGESVALLEAISYVESHGIPRTIIFSDCKSCLQAILSNQFKSKNKFPLILRIKDLLLKCEQKKLEIVLAWIPSHCGIEGNEWADSWAKDAIQSGSQDHNQTYSSDLLMLARSDMRESWQEFWDSSRHIKGRYYGDIQSLIPHKPWFFRFRSGSKQATSTICRLRLGHSCTPVFLSKIRVRDHSLCECGFEDGTPDHIFFNCQKYSFSLYDILPRDIPRPINFHSLLIFTDSPFVNYLIKYIQLFDIKL